MCFRGVCSPFPCLCITRKKRSHQNVLVYTLHHNFQCRCKLRENSTGRIVKLNDGEEHCKISMSSGPFCPVAVVVGQYSHHSDVIMSVMASQITDISVYSTVWSGLDQRKQQSSASLASVWEIPQWPVNSPHKGPVTRKFFHFMTSSVAVVQWLGFTGLTLAK